MPSKKTKSKSTSGKLNFEQSLEGLQGIVDELENGNLTLSDSLEKYEQGVKHLKNCHQALQSAQKKIEMLVALDDGGNLAVEPFDDSATREIAPKATRSGRSRKASKPSTGDIDDSESLF